MRAPTRTSESGKVHRLRVIPTTACGKQGYVTRKLAATAAAVERKRSGEPIFAYRCVRGCHLFHIGHPPGWKRDHGRAA